MAPRYPTIQLNITVNDRVADLTIQPRETLAYVLRHRLGLTGTKVSCDAQICGACTVMVDGLPVSACTTLAVDALNKQVTTIEGLVTNGELHPLQEAFLEHSAFQCGFCTPGFIVSAAALLGQVARPSREAILEWLDGNICRCTGYESIVAAVLSVVDDDQSAEPIGQ